MGNIITKKNVRVRLSVISTSGNENRESKYIYILMNLQGIQEIPGQLNIFKNISDRATILGTKLLYLKI